MKPDSDGIAGIVVTITRRRRPHLRNLRVQLRGLLDGYQKATHCRGAVARRRFDEQVVKVLVVHQQDEFLPRENAKNAKGVKS